MNSPEDTTPKKWNVNIYQGHIGIVDENGNSVANVIGKRGDHETHRIANLIVLAVNTYLAYEEAQNGHSSPFLR